MFTIVTDRNVDTEGGKRDNSEMEHKLYYKHYCKILSKIIKEAKKKNYIIKKLLVSQKIK